MPELSPDTSSESTAIDSLYRISSLLSDTDDPKVALNFIVKEIVRVLRPNTASISLLNPDSQRLELEVTEGLPASAANVTLEIGQGLTGWVALHGETLIVPDVRKDKRYVCIKDSIRSEMVVPMIDRGSIIGVVNVNSEQVGAFDAQSHKILKLLTNEATRVVTQLWLIRQLRTKANQLETLVNVSQNIVGELASDDILRGLAKEGRKLMDCQCCAVFLLDPDQTHLELHSMVGRQGPVDVINRLAINTSAMGTAIVRRKQIEVSNLAFTEENDFQHVIQQQGLVSMLASPIIYKERVVGVLNAYTDRQQRFNNDEKKIFTTLSRLGAIAIQNARLYSRIFSSEEALRRNEKLTTLGMLAAEIAHEIRNPLTVIKLLFDSLDLEFSLEDARQRDVEVIGEKLDHLEEIVGRVLNFGRNRDGLHARYDLNALLEDTLRLVRHKLQQQKIGLEYTPHTAPIFVDVHKGQIQQVALNLILNAVQAMPDGGRIYISTQAEPDMAAFTVQDSGPGIPLAIQSSIFESFLTNRADGTGLGLSISKRIMRGHRGNIELIQSDQNGSCFRAWLPVSQPIQN
jgi:signal transduction histidine kinase